ncbi:MAG: metalloprotease PmbA, partial [Pseudomonadota bacterium]
MTAKTPRPSRSKAAAPAAATVPAQAPEAGFAYSRAQFADLVEQTLEIARSLGASDAGVEVSEGSGLSVSVRKGRLENVERNRDKAVGVTVYLG